MLGSSSRSQEESQPLCKHARTVAGESAELPLPALGPLEERERRDGARYPAPREGRQLKLFAAPRPPPPPHPPFPTAEPGAGREKEEEGRVG